MNRRRILRFAIGVGVAACALPLRAQSPATGLRRVGVPARFVTSGTSFRSGVPGVIGLAGVTLGIITSACTKPSVKVERVVGAGKLGKVHGAALVIGSWHNWMYPCINP